MSQVPMFLAAPLDLEAATPLARPLNRARRPVP